LPDPLVGITMLVGAGVDPGVHVIGNVNGLIRVSTSLLRIQPLSSGLVNVRVWNHSAFAVRP
jgi:hypothetical protein